jgi:TonB family protein
VRRAAIVIVILAPLAGCEPHGEPPLSALGPPPPAATRAPREPLDDGSASNSPAPPTPSADGNLVSPSPKSAEQVIRSEIQPGAKLCFVEALRATPDQLGRLVITLRIDPDGNVIAATVASNQGLSPGLGDCVANVARQARFSPPGLKGATISIPFSFKRAAPN